jgi:hypothetical protein
MIAGRLGERCVDGFIVRDDGSWVWAGTHIGPLRVLSHGVWKRTVREERRRLNNVTDLQKARD